MKVEEACRRGNVVKFLDNVLGWSFSKKSLLFRMHGFHVNCWNDCIQNQWRAEICGRRSRTTNEININRRSSFLRHADISLVTE